MIVTAIAIKNVRVIVKPHTMHNKFIDSHPSKANQLKRNTLICVSFFFTTISGYLIHLLQIFVCNPNQFLMVF